MSGPSPRPHVFPKKRFQAATVSAIDQHAAVLQQLAEKQRAQGEVLADLAVARDAQRAFQAMDWKARLRWILGR